MSAALLALLGVVILSLSILLAVAGLIFVQRRIPLELRQSHNDTIGIIYGALHVAFGVIIGFSAFLVLDKYTTSHSTVVNEAGSVRALYQLAEQFPESQRDQIQGLATSYAQVVVDEEWPLMSEGKMSLRAATLAQELTQSTESFVPNSSAQQAIFAQALERIHDLNQSRDTRLLYAREGLPPLLWVVLVILAVIIILFTYFLGMESTKLHVLAVAALTAGITFTMFAIVALDHPFGGDLRVRPVAFESVLAELEAYSQQGV
jgi:hypothetical protein